MSTGKEIGGAFTVERIAYRGLGATEAAGASALPAGQRREQVPSVTWTRPFYGIQHTRQRINGRWATVTEWESCVELDGWYEGCGFNPYGARFDTLAEARAAGERWVLQGVFP
jgi:hypothetical protein